MGNIETTTKFSSLGIISSIEDNYFFTLQKQPTRGVLKKRCSEIYSKFTGEHSCRSVISIKLLCNFIEISLRHECSPANMLHIFRTTFLRNTSGWLLLTLIFFFFQVSLYNYKGKLSFFIVKKKIFIETGFK